VAKRILRTRRKPYRIVLPEDGSWSLHDLYVFPRAYEQCYAFVYCLDTDLSARDKEAIDYALGKYPWKGGYSYVNIYAVLMRQVPVRDRPRLESMHKASEGWIDLILNVEAAKELAKSVAMLSGAAVTAAAAYKRAYSLLADIKTERERARLQKIQLRQRQIKALRLAADELAKSIGFKNLAELDKRTNDPEVTLKLLAAQYRRLKTLLGFESKEKAQLPLDDDV
jgi:hypothetical protein